VWCAVRGIGQAFESDGMDGGVLFAALDEAKAERRLVAVLGLAPPRASSRPVQLHFPLRSPPAGLLLPRQLPLGTCGPRPLSVCRLLRLLYAF
jgi:hypothetical protein